MRLFSQISSLNKLKILLVLGWGGRWGAGINRATLKTIANQGKMNHTFIDVLDFVFVCVVHTANLVSFVNSF